MKPVPLDKCKWCNGLGTDLSVSPDCPCMDCEATGYKYGREADAYNEYLIEQGYQEYLKKQKDEGNNSKVY